MQCFTVRNHIHPYMELSPEPYPHVRVGEEGRGRKLTRFPVGRAFAESVKDSAKIERASVLKTRGKGTLLLVEERKPGDKRALVLLGIPAGFRGGTRIMGGTGDPVPCPQRGLYDPYVEDGRTCVFCGAPFSGRTHPDTGESIWTGDPALWRGITVLADGHVADGTAGRMGGNAELLLIMNPGARLRVRRTGRLYGAPSVLIVFWDGQDLKVGTPDEIDPPVDETEGEIL